MTSTLEDVTVRSQRSIDLLLTRMVEARGADLHLQVGIPPRISVDGDKVDLPGIGIVDDAFVESVVFDQILADRPMLADRLRKEWDLDASYTVENVGRFRVNVHREREHYSTAIRVIPAKPPRFDELGLPDVIATFARYKNGLVIFGGETGSGKSTALASIVDLINRSRAATVLTVEDPVEFIHQSQKSIIRHREVGTDVVSFDEALRRALRQQPDVILLGEMRDPETIQLAVTMAGLGCLVFGTLHTKSARETIPRIVDVFPENVQNSVRVKLSTSIAAVVCQQLVKKKHGVGRVPATEIMIVDNPIRAAIRDGKIGQIQTSITTGRDKGSRLMDFSLSELVRRNEITEDEAVANCDDLDTLNSYLNNSMSSSYVPGSNSSMIYDER